MKYFRMPTSYASSKQVDDVLSEDLDVTDAELRLNVVGALPHGGKDVVHGPGYDARAVEVRPEDGLVVRSEHRMRLPGSRLPVNEHGGIKAYISNISDNYCNSYKSQSPFMKSMMTPAVTVWYTVFWPTFAGNTESKLNSLSPTSGVIRTTFPEAGSTE